MPCAPLFAPLVRRREVTNIAAFLVGRGLLVVLLLTALRYCARVLRRRRCACAGLIAELGERARARERTPVSDAQARKYGRRRRRVMRGAAAEGRGGEGTETEDESGGERARDPVPCGGVREHAKTVTNGNIREQMSVEEALREAALEWEVQSEQGDISAGAGQRRHVRLLSARDK